MRRLLLLAALCGIVLLVASPALAQDDLNCDDFGSQAEAQAELRSDPSDPNGLDAENDGVACETTPYDDPARDETPVTPAQSPGGDLDCEDFGSQEEAQAEFDADPSDPNGLNADGDGQACEEFPYPGTEPLPEGSPPLPDGETLEPAEEQYETETATPNETPTAAPTSTPSPDATPTVTQSETPTETPAETPTPSETPSVSVESPEDSEVESESRTTPYTELPDTGGPSMLLPVGALILGAGILGFAVIRRR